MFIPNGTCYIRRKLNSFTKYGEPAYGNKTSIPFAQVRFDAMTEDSTVRADSSATRGNIKEFHASGRLLVPASVAPSWGDLFIVHGKVFQAKQVEPRYSVLGVLDHYQVDYIKSDDLFGDEA
jgi:hypothetical protein